MHHHGMTFNFDSAKVCSPAIFETCFSYEKDMWISKLIIICILHNCTISIDSYTPINEFYSFVIFSLVINAFTLQLKYLFLILYLYINFFL